MAERDEARRTNPVTITRTDHRKIAKVFHPDAEAHATKKQLTEAAQIFTASKFKFID